MRKYIVSLFILSLLATCIQAKTLAQLRISERYKLNDSTDTVSAVRWTDTVLNVRNNDIQRNIAEYTRCIYAQHLTTPTADVREYLKPAKNISIDRVSMINVTSTTASTQYKKLEARTIGGLDVQFPGGWENRTSGLPQYYYERGDYIGFECPVKNVYCSTGSIKMDYFKYPDDMTADTDEPFDGLDYLTLYHDIIILGVVAMCKQDENKDNTAIVAEYTSKINMMIDSINRKTDQSVQHIKIGQ